MTRVIAKEELPYGKIAHRFEGYRYGEVNWVCPVFTDCLPLSRSTSSQSNFFVL